MCGITGCRGNLGERRKLGVISIPGGRRPLGIHVKLKGIIGLILFIKLFSK